MSNKIMKLIVAGSMVGTIFGIANGVSAQSNDVLDNTQYKNVLNQSMNSESEFLSFSTTEGETIKIGTIKSVNFQYEDSNMYKFNSFSNKKEVAPKIKKVENGIEQTVEIEPLNASADYKIPFDFQNGESIKLEKDGSAVVYNKNKDSIAVIMPTEAKTKSGEILEVKTKLTNGNTLAYHVNFKGEAEPVTIVARALSYSFSEYFSSGKWITRDGVISLSLQPKSLLTKANSNPNVNGAIRTDSWNKVKSKFSGSSNWRNTGSMENQYYCHVDTAQRFKTPWNLEPHRSNVGYWQTVKKLCNP